MPAATLGMLAGPSYLTSLARIFFFFHKFQKKQLSREAILDNEESKRILLLRNKITELSSTTNIQKEEEKNDKVASFKYTHHRRRKV